ncbi:MAG: sensor histidine kinase [Candidatus Methanoperedens sp.]|nr:sensor histidine kinase [Candidatus Methanoperedens sp.]MCZ7371383.1 sensor histidine kinase [Candidatus Methanoperedens sp.]
MGIRSELIIFFLLISVIPLSIVVYTSYNYGKDAISASVTDSLLGATENAGHAIDNWMEARKDDVRIISRIAANSKKEELHEYLNTFESEHEGVYEEFFIMNPDGDIIFSTLNNTGNASMKTYFTEAARGKMFISDVSFSAITGSPEIMITNPIRKNDTMTGIMGARVSMENLYRIIDGIDIGKLGEIFMVNKDGELIFHKNRSMILLEKINNNLAVREVTYEKNGAGEYVNYKGEKVLGSYYWLPLYRWGLIVEKNKDEAYAEILVLGRLTVAISFLAVLCVVLLAVVISRRLTEPVKSLEEGALGLVKGNFKPVPVSSKNEIGRLTEIFNQTAKELLDIRKRLEAKIEIADKDLAEKNKELIVANEELKKLDTLKSDFISLVSHELKTPLSAIRTSAEFLESEDVTDMAVQKEMLSIIIRNIDRQTLMINEILDLSKIEAGKMEFKMEEVDFQEIANVTLENIGQLALKKNITISMNIPGKLSPLFADREKLIIVLNNLLGNALKFTPDGGRIILSAKELKDSIEINIEDNGIGVEKDKLERIFDKFYQVDSTSRRKIGGSGLGLSISSGIIRAHNSEILVDSELGKGSRFYFRLKKVVRS